MSQRHRGIGKDLCGRVHAVTGVECYLPDTHFPHPHRSLDGDSWHDGLCTTCAGGGTTQVAPGNTTPNSTSDTTRDASGNTTRDTTDDAIGAICPRCNGTGFEPIALIDPDTYQPG